MNTVKIFFTSLLGLDASRSERMKFLLVFGLLLVLCLVVYAHNASGAAQNDIALARQAVEAQGYADVRYLDTNISACGRDAAAGYEFEAAINGNRGRVVACPVPRGYFRIVVKGQ